jgi:hypothetical protein
MRRRTFLLSTATAVLLADTRQELVELFGGMATALSDGDVRAFLRAVDPSLPDYAKFASNLGALIRQNELSSSIEIEKQDGDDNAQSVELDWLLEIKGAAQILRRQTIVKCKVERRKKRWKVVSINPPDFFAPPLAK